MSDNNVAKAIMRRNFTKSKRHVLTSLSFVVCVTLYFDNGVGHISGAARQQFLTSPANVDNSPRSRDYAVELAR
jgi:hypothetical protein